MNYEIILGDPEQATWSHVHWSLSLFILVVINCWTSKHTIPDSWNRYDRQQLPRHCMCSVWQTSGTSMAWISRCMLKLCLVAIANIWFRLQLLHHLLYRIQTLMSLVSEAPIKGPTSPHPGTGGAMGGDLTTMWSMTLYLGQNPSSNVIKSPV